MAPFVLRLLRLEPPRVAARPVSLAVAGLAAILLYLER
jgi:hypothetical protein